MTLTSKPLAVILLVLLFGGIALSSGIGLWATESTKVPAAFTEGEFAGQANPADIRGSYTFGDIAASFAVAPDILAQAFGIVEEDPSAFAVKNLEAVYADSGYEIGTTSVRLFVAFYTGSPFDTTDQEIYLPEPATDMLLAKGSLSADRTAYLENHTVSLDGAGFVPVSVPETSSTPPPAAATSEEYTVRGKTTFGELLTWGVPQTVIEEMIGNPVPDPAMTVKEYASDQGLDFEILRPALQAEVDQVKP